MSGLLPLTSNRVSAYRAVAWKKTRLLDLAHERVADPAEQRVERPDRERVLAAGGEFLHVRAEVVGGRFPAEAESRRRVRAHLPATRLERPPP